MPTFTIPLPENMGTQDPVNTPQDYPGARQVYLPANQAILDSLELGEEVKMEIVGKVVSLEQREREGDDAAPFLEFGVEIRKIDAYGENEYENMARDDD